MKEFIFVSDFDGTLTKKDFYKIIADNYLSSIKDEIYAKWNSRQYKDYEMLDVIYSSANRSEEEFFEDILSIPIDPYFKKFVDSIRNSGGDFIILSAGTNYYIEKLLSYMGITDIPIISNKSYYKDRGIHLEIKKENPYYSDFFGIDKGKVVKELKEKYTKVYFAGDSNPDVDPAKLADIVFATGKLNNLLNNINLSYVPFNDLTDIDKYLKSIGVLV